MTIAVLPRVRPACASTTTRLPSRLLLPATLLLSLATVPALGYPAMDIVEAARADDVHAVRNLLESDPSLVRATDAIGYTALDWATTRGYARIVTMLLEAGAPVDGVGWDGGTVLHRACHHDDPDMVRELLDAGADLRVANQWGRTPLHAAVRRGCLAVARLLLDRGADPDAATKEGWTCLHVACRAGHPDLAELLLARGADPELRDDDGKRPAECVLARPAPVPLDPARLDEYAGLFDIGHGLSIKVWRAGDVLGIREFAPDLMDPVGEDEFFCRREPWRVRFVRGDDGAITAVKVDFLRRTIRAERLPSPRYVGSAACRECHMRDGDGEPYVGWLAGRHALAYWRLATGWAAFLAARRPFYRDVTSCIDDRRCLMCHATAVRDENALAAPGFDRAEGVGCEACHGPGSLYTDPAVMADRERFLAAGGIVPDETTCRRCHRDDGFAYAEYLSRLGHPAARAEEDE